MNDDVSGFDVQNRPVRVCVETVRGITVAVDAGNEKAIFALEVDGVDVAQVVGELAVHAGRVAGL